MERPPYVSEVARLREQIRLETEAANRALNDPAMVGKHEFITSKYANLDKLQHALAEQTSEEESWQTIVDISNEVFGCRDIAIDNISKIAIDPTMQENA